MLSSSSSSTPSFSPFPPLSSSPPPSPSSSLPSSSSLAPLPQLLLSSLLLRHRLHLLFLRDRTRSSSLVRAGERHRTTENKVFLRYPALSSRAASPLFSHHFRVEYTRKRRGFISVSARGTRVGARTAEELYLLFLVSFSLSLLLSVSRAANQTVCHESWLLKRIVFHAHRVTD